MDAVSADLVAGAFRLLPGFLAAWVFYGLTAHPRRDAFERLIQALVFTVIVQAVVAIAALITRVFGYTIPVSDPQSVSWSLTSALAAVFVGVSFATLVNHDALHALLRLLKITCRTSFPSEWYSAFARRKPWVVLHLKGSRRLYGWAAEWPDEPTRGHFIIEQPEWLLAGAQRAPLFNVDAILIPVEETEFVEFVRQDAEVNATPDELAAVEKLLVEQQGDAEDDSKAATAGTQPAALHNDTGHTPKADARRISIPARV